MGRIGRSYPRFQPQQPEQPEHDPAPPGRSASQVIGAVVGLLAALGLIGWLLSR